MPLGETDSGLVGRDAELAALTSILDRAVTGSRAGSIVHVIGDPGIGKSRLLDAFAAIATARGVPAMLGRAAEFEAHVPFTAVTDALDAPLARAVRDGAIRLDESESALLPQVLPSLETASWVAPRVERYRLHRALRAVIGRVAEERGLVLAFDDVHWADQSTLEALRYLTSRPPHPPMVTILSYRPRQLDLEPTSPPAVTLELGPLGERDAAILLGPDMPVSRRRELYSRSAGNPLYLIELARNPDQVGDNPFQRELAALPETESVVLRAAAVAGDEADLTLLAAIAELPEPRTAQAMVTLMARDLLRSSARAWRYRHPLLRQAVYAGAPPGWRMAAHRRAAEELARRGDSRMAVAEHVNRCAIPGDLAAVDRLTDAAEHAVRIAPASAARWLDTALRLLPGTDECSGRRVDLLTRRAGALHRSGALSEAREAVQRALGLVSGEEHSRLVGLAATVERLLGRYEQARALLRSELERRTDRAHDTTTDLLMELVVVSVLAGDFPAAARVAATIVTERNVGSVVTAANLALSALAASTGGAVTTQMLARLTEADQLVDSLTDDELSTLIEIPVWLGLADIRADRLTDARRHLVRGLDVAERTSQLHVFTYLKLLLATCDFGFGDLDRAAEHAEDALDSALLSGNDQFTLMALLRQANIMAWQGDLDAAEDVLGRAGRLAESMSNAFGQQVALGQASCRYLRGEPDACVEMILDATNGGDLATLLTAAPVEWLELLAEAETVAGRPDRAADWAKRAADACAELPTGRQRGLAALASAWPALPESPAEAARSAVRAAAILQVAGDSLGTGRALLLAGRAAVAAGDRDGASIWLVRARAALHRAGARGLLAEVDATTRRIEVGGQASRPLSERERTITELVLGGHPNREIAARLHLSTRSVEASLSRIYAALGVRGRTQLIARLSRPDS